MNNYWVVDVAVALRRPPREDRWSRIILEADTAEHAVLDALYQASRNPGVVMPVRYELVGSLDAQPDPNEVDALVAQLRVAVQERSE